MNEAMRKGAGGILIGQVGKTETGFTTVNQESKEKKKSGQSSSTVSTTRIETNRLVTAKLLKDKWLIPSASVFQIAEYFAQNWSLGFGKNDFPKAAIAFKALLGAAQTRHAPRQVIGMVKVD